jgi:ubiquinone/menaquinone biosynthesis C-methylase UbiE
MDAGRLALREASVDAAVTPFMLFFLPDPSRGLAEAHRVLRPGAGLGVATWHEGGITFRADDIWTGLLDGYGARPDPAPSKLELMDTAEKLSAILEDVGFRDVRTATEREPVAVSLEEFLEQRTRTVDRSSASPCPWMSAQPWSTKRKSDSASWLRRTSPILR